MLRSTDRRRAQRGIAAFTAFSMFWSTVLPAQTLILPDGNTATQVQAAGNIANVSTGTVRGTNAFNSFSRFNVGAGDTVNLQLPHGTQNLLNLVHDERTAIDGVLNSIRNGQVGGTLYFANPHGLVVGPSGVVNTGALHAVTPTQDFMRRFFSAPGEPSADATAQLMNGSAPLNPDGLISIQGQVNTVSGATLDAGQIRVAGEIRATAPAAAGFGDAVNLSGLDTAAGVTLDAGEISLQAVGDVDVSGTLAAEGRDGVNGGDIAIAAGRDIRLAAPARISVSGRGADSDGGRVVVLADRTTHLAAGATVEARGGDQSGDGGFIELSARERVQLAGGRLDAGAPNGRGGDVLLDPPSFELTDGSASPSAPSTLVFSGSSLTLEADDFIRLDNFSISTRVVDGNGNSTADSGSITLTADRIELINGSTLDARANQGKKAGNITLTALAGSALLTDASLLATANLPANGGKILIEATDSDALPDPFVASATGTIDLQGAQLKAREVEIKATATAGYVFDHRNAASAVEGDDSFWNADTFGEDIVGFFKDARPLVGVSISNTTATLNLATSALGHVTQIEASGAATLTAEASSSATIDSYGVITSVGYARSKADATVSVGTGSEITAGGPLTIGAFIDNRIDVSATVIDPSESAKGQVPVDVAVAVTEAYGTAATTIASGAKVTGTGTGSNGKLSILAGSSKDLSTSVQAGGGNDFLAATVAVTLSDTQAHTTVNGEVSSAAELLIQAKAETVNNEIESASKIGDTFFEHSKDDLAKYAGLNRATVIQSIAEWITSKQETGGKVPGEAGSSADGSDTKTNAFMRDNGISAAVLVANHTNAALATVGGGADLEAIGNLSVLAEAIDRQALSATSEASPSRDNTSGSGTSGDKKNAAAASVIVANFDNIARATIGGSSDLVQAHVDALGTLKVDAKVSNPFEVKYPAIDLVQNGFSLSNFLKAVPDDSLYVPGALFNAWAQSAGEGDEVGIAGSVNLFDVDNTVEAKIGNFAIINGDTGFFGNAQLPGDVAVSATVDAVTVNLSGVADFFLQALVSLGKNIFSTGGTKAGMGGSALATFYTNNVLATIDNGAQVDAQNLSVFAATDVSHVSIAIAGAKAGKYAFGGSFSWVGLTNFTTARIGDGAVVDAAGTLSILANDSALDVNVAGGIAVAKNLGVGAAITWNDIERQTLALIGTDPFATTPVSGSGSVNADGAMSLAAASGGDIWTASLAGAVAGNDKDTPKASTPTVKTDPESVPEPGAEEEEPGAPARPAEKPKADAARTTDNKGLSGLHISADVAVNEIDDDTKAYVNGGASVSSGVATAPAAGATVPASLALSATNDSEIWALGGAVTANLGTGGSGTSVGLAGSFALNDIFGATEAFLAGSRPVTSKGDITLGATRSGGIRALTASVAGTTQKSGLNLSGNVSLNELDNVTAAYLLGADINALAEAGNAQTGALTLSAEDDSSIYAIGGAVTLGGKGGFGATVVVNDVGNETQAYSSRSRVRTAGDFALSARNANDIRAIGASLGITQGAFSASGVGVANTFKGQRVAAWVDNTGTAYMTPATANGPATPDTELHVLGNVTIDAEDESEIETIAAAAGAAKTAGIGVSIAVNRIEQSGVSAYAKNVAYHRVDRDFSLAARSLAGQFAATDGNDLDEDPDNEADNGGIRVIAGAVGIGKGVGAGVAVAVNRLSATTDAFITGPLADITANNVLVDATGAGSITAIAAGVGASGSFGLGGSVVTNYIGNTTSARIDGGATVEAKHDVGVRAQTDDRISVAAGGAGIGLNGVGLGAAITVNKIDSTTSARIGNGAGDRTQVLARTGDATGTGLTVANGRLAGDVVLGDAVEIAQYSGPDLKSLREDATKQVTGVAVNSMSTQHIENIDVTVGAGKVGLGAAVNVNLIKGSSVAEIINADINRATGAANQQVDVTAGNVAYGNGFVGNVTVGMGAAGAGVDTHVFGRTTRAGVTNSTVDAQDSLRVDAESLQGASSLVIGAAVGGLALVGSGSVAKFTGVTEAFVSNSTLDARRIDIRADAEDRLHLAGGGLAVGAGTGASGTFALAINDSTTRAFIDGGLSGRSALWAADGVSVIANGLMDITTYAIGGAGAGGTGIAGVASVNLATSLVEARVQAADIGQKVGDTERPVGSLEIAAEGDITLLNVAGGLGAGLGGGVGAGASVNILKSRVVATLADSTVKAKKAGTNSGAVNVTAHSTNDVDATAIMAGVGGSFGIGGAAVVTLIGEKPDAEANREIDQGGTGTLSTADSLGSASRLDDVGTSDNVAFGADDRTAIDGQSSHAVKQNVNDTSRIYETAARITNTTIDAATTLVEARDESVAKTLVGGFGVSLGLGAGGGVGVTFMRSNVQASIDADSSLTLSETLRVRALVGPDPETTPPEISGLVDIQAIAGAAGLVGLGAAVGVAKVDNVVSAEVAGNVTAGGVTIEARDDTSIEIDAANSTLGAAAAGVSFGRATKTSHVTAATVGGTTARHTTIVTTDADATTPDGSVTISAASGGKIDVEVTAAAGGLGIAASGADARANDASTVTAQTGSHSEFRLGSAALNVSAVSESATRALAHGYSVSGGAAVGVSIAKATAGTTVLALFDDATKIAAGGLSVSAWQVRRADTEFGLMPTAYSYASGSGGGLLVGINASQSDAITGANVRAALNTGTLLDISGDVGVFANGSGLAQADVSGLAAGAFAFGANKSTASATGTTLAEIAAVRNDAADGTAIDGHLTISAVGSDGALASAEAGAGGIVAGAVASAKTFNTSTATARVTSAPVVGGRLAIEARHRADLGGSVNSTSASVVGASGGEAMHSVVSTVTAEIVDHANLRAGGLRMLAHNSAYKVSNGFDLTAGAGGIFGGAAASTYSGVTLNTKAAIGQHAQLRLTAPTDAGGGASVAAENHIQLNDRVKLDAGGAIAVALAKSTISASLLASATLGEGALLDSLGDVYFAAGNQGSALASANAKTYGLAGAAQGHSVSTINADALIGVATLARIRSDGDITLAAGRDANGAADALTATARTDLYNKTVFPVETSPDADASVVHHSTVEVAAGGRVNAVQDITLIADRGYVVADGSGIGKDLYRELIAAIASFFSNLFGGGDVSLDIHGGSSSVQNLGIARVNGEVAAGIQHAQKLAFNRAGEKTAQTEGVRYTITDEDIVQNLLSDLKDYEALVADYAGNPKAQAAYENEVLRIQTQLRDLGYTADLTRNDGSELVPVLEVMAKFVNVEDVRARGGNVTVEAGALVGNGLLDAPGDASIEIDNASAMNFRLEKMTIEDVGGRLTLNGAVVRNNADINLRNGAGATADFDFPTRSGAGGPPTISVKNSYIPDPRPEPVPGQEPDVDGSIHRAPDIQITDDLTNLNGVISVKNARGSVLVTGDDPESGPRITADTIDIAAGGDFVQAYVNGLYNIGGEANDPSKLWRDIALAAEGQKTDRINDSGARSGSGSIIAGNNVFISARYLNINGTIQSGIDDWSLTLDEELADDMDAFRDDYRATLLAGGAPETNLLQLSAFLDDPQGTIGAFYNAETDRIELESVRVRGGYMQLFGEIISTGGGQLNVIDGYGLIEVTNDTGRELVVNSLDTGNGIEGKLLITNTGRMATVADPKNPGAALRARPVTTKIERIGADVRRQDLVLINGEEVAIGDPDFELGTRDTDYTPVPGTRYVWTTGKDYVDKYLGMASTTSLFGFIPIDSSPYNIGYFGPTAVQDQPIRLGEFVEVGATDAPDYSYDFEHHTTPGSEAEYAGRESWSECSFWFFGCIARTYYIRDTWISGSRDFNTHSVRADHAIDIRFIGEDVGALAINSDASLHLNGLVRNTSGTAALTSTAGSIDAISDFAAIRARDISLSAATGIGSAATAVVTEALGGAVTATTATGDVALATGQGDLVIREVSTRRGAALLSADGSLLGTSGGLLPHVSARRIELNAALGSIGSGSEALRIAAGVRTDTGADSGLDAGLSALAVGDIDLVQTSGDLALDSVVSLDGDVTIAALDGSLLDGNTHDVRDTRAETDLLALWKGLGLTGAEAETSRLETIAAYKANKEAEYRRYWQYRTREVRDDDGLVTGSEIVAYDPAFTYIVSGTERQSLTDAGLDANAIGDYAENRTSEYHRLHGTWGGGPYNPDFSYTVTGTIDNPETELGRLSEGYLWQENELRYGLSGNVVFKTVTDTETAIEEANVTGRHVSLKASQGSVGAERTPIVIDGKQEGLEDFQRIALAAAEADDIAMDTVKEEVTVLRREDVDVFATGAIAIEGRDHVYLGGESDLNVEAVTSDGQVRIKGAGGIFDVSTGPAPTVQAGGLIVEAAQGDIGAAGDPLRIALASGTSLTARAGGSLFIDERVGELRVAEVFARNTASLAAERSILDTRAAAVVAVNAAAVRLTSRQGDIGTAAHPFALRARDGGSVGGSAAGSIDLTSPADHLTIGSLVAGGDVRLASAGSLKSNGSAPNVIGREISLQALGGTLGSPDAFFSIDSNGGVTALADTGLWLDEWNGDLFARRIATRTGPLNVRVRNGNAIFDTLVSDEVLKLTLAGGSLSVAYIDALGVELSLLEEGARLAVGDLHVRDAIRLKADHIYLPQVFHKGGPDTLRITAIGNDGGLSDEVTMHIESPSPVLFDQLRAKTASIFSNSGVLQLEDTTITQDANIAHPGALVSVVNGVPTLTRANVQLFSDGRAFRLVLTDGQRLVTDAVIVNYDDSLIINAFSTENSVLRQTRKVFSVQDSQGGPLFEPDALEDAALLDFGPLGGERFWTLPARDGAAVEP